MWLAPWRPPRREPSLIENRVSLGISLPGHGRESFRLTEGTGREYVPADAAGVSITTAPSAYVREVTRVPRESYSSVKSTTAP